MKKFFIIIGLIIFIVILLNLPVSYRQGVNFKVRNVRIPLYLKVVDFFDRHYNYENLTGKIISASDNKEQRAMKLLVWTQDNIRDVPEGFSIVDDHVWHIIIRGYGTTDQFNDVFTTLCNYAGVDAFFDFIHSKDNNDIMPLSFLKLGNRWCIFDAYNGVYFKNNTGEIASLEDIKRGDWIVFNAAKAIKQNADYIKHLESIPLITHIGLRRANIQSPLRRLIFQLKSWRGLR